MKQNKTNTETDGQLFNLVLCDNSSCSPGLGLTLRSQWWLWTPAVTIRSGLFGSGCAKLRAQGFVHSTHWALSLPLNKSFLNLHLFGICVCTCVCMYVRVHVCVLAHAPVLICDDQSTIFRGQLSSSIGVPRIKLRPLDLASKCLYPVEPSHRPSALHFIHSKKSRPSEAQQASLWKASVCEEVYQRWLFLSGSLTLSSALWDKIYCWKKFIMYFCFMLNYPFNDVLLGWFCVSYVGGLLYIFEVS